MLTGLYNRFEFEKRLEEQLDEGKNLTLLLIDIDNFKLINDSYGHTAGDELLGKIGKSISSIFGPKTKGFRLGGDEFAIILDITKIESIQKTAYEIIKKLSLPFKLDNDFINLTASIGIAITEEKIIISKKSLLRRSDRALYKAKELGRNNYVIYSHELKKDSARQQEILSRLIQAIDDKIIIPHYQPIVDIQNKKVSHCEALARWEDSKFGKIPPDEFIQIAEGNGLIKKLGALITGIATREIFEINNNLPSPIGVTLNRSPQEFFHSANSGETSYILKAIEDGFPSSLLSIELTESLMIANPTIAKEALQHFRNLDMGIAIDDFGTGYSSLSYLKHYPFNILKIDKSFIQGMEQSKEDFALVKTMIDMANNMGMKVVAEGVETQEQLIQLEKLGCDYVQGYIFSPALSAKELKNFVISFKYSEYN